MVRAGVAKAGLDYRKAYTLQFVEQEGRARPQEVERRSAMLGRADVESASAQPTPLAQRCAASARSSPTARGRWRDARSRGIRQGEFSRCSARRAAASRRRLRIIAGLERADRRARSNGRGSGASGRQRSRIGFVFQEPTLMPWASVFDNVLAAAQISQGAPRDRRPDRVDARCSTASAWRHSPTPIRANCPAA